MQLIMKRGLLLTLMMVVVCITANAGNKNKNDKKESPVDSTRIHWMNWDEVQAKMKKEPKKVWVDVYTDWCGWCKRMDATTFQHKEVIKYMNKYFYAVKFNAEKEDSIRFQGNMYYLSPDKGASDLAVLLMRDQLSYPTFIYMEENFQNHFPIPGYQTVEKMEPILKFLAEEGYKNMKWEEYTADFHPTWGTNTP